MSFTLPDLPFAKDALEPHMSSDTLDYHHGKHHKAYVEKANKMTEGTDIQNMDLEDAVVAAKDKDQGTFNNVAQHYNHSFFWKCLTPNGGGEPTGALAEQIKKDFGSLDDFKKAFKEKGAGQFGSGWAWLCYGDDNKLCVCNTANAENPLTKGRKPLLTCDVWEHAYYLDYQNRRPDFLDTFLDKLVNWEFAAENFDKAKDSLKKAA